jgi:hypothetical protein
MCKSSINIEYYNNIKLKQNYKNENLIPGNQLLPRPAALCTIDNFNDEISTSIPFNGL